MARDAAQQRTNSVRASAPPPAPRRASRGARAVSRLDLDSAFFWLLLVFLATALVFLSAPGRTNVALNPRQIAEYSRRTQGLSNSTVYIVEVARPEGLLSTLTREEWARVSSRIDYVAFVFDDLPLFLTDEWVARAEEAFHGGALDIALFPCGCVMPNAYFMAVPHRLNGLECVLLPGWVLPHASVHWLDAGAPACKRRDAVLAARGAKRYSTELKEIRDILDGLRAHEELAPPDTNSTATDAIAADQAKPQDGVVQLPKEAPAVGDAEAAGVDAVGNRNETAALGAGADIVEVRGGDGEALRAPAGSPSPASVPQNNGVGS